MTVTVTVLSRIPLVAAEIEAKIAAAVETAAFEIEREAKTRAAVDTGYMRANIAASGKATDWRVDSPANYSLFVELGTVKMAAQPFLIPAKEAVKPKLMAMLSRLA